MSKEKKCDGLAKIALPWGGKILNYCPVHANQLVMIANHTGNPIRVQWLPDNVVMECESVSELSEYEKTQNEMFVPGH